MKSMRKPGEFRRAEILKYEAPRGGRTSLWATWAPSDPKPPARCSPFAHLAARVALSIACKQRGILWMVAKSTNRTALKPWLKLLFVGIYKRIESLQGVLGGGFCPSTVPSICGASH